MEKKIITNFKVEELELELEKLGIERFRAKQIFKWVFKKGVFDFEKMSDLPKDKIKILDNYFKILDVKLGSIKFSEDSTAKFLINLNDGYCIESVLLHDGYRLTACLSSQVGCPLGCRFCLSGRFKFKRNLTVCEIIGQLLLLAFNKRDDKTTINNIVFMGMGEPLLNYDNVLKAIKIIISKDSFNIGTRKITISTAGIIPGINKLMKEKMQLRLSISLHSPFQSVREKIMPLSIKYSLGQLIMTAKKYISKKVRRITFEYVLIKGINDSLNDAKKLSMLLQSISCSINLIPYNKTRENCYQAPPLDVQNSFKKILLSNGINVTLRKKRGSDINAACGQLSLGHIDK